MWNAAVARNFFEALYIQLALGTQFLPMLRPSAPVSLCLSKSRDSPSKSDSDFAVFGDGTVGEII